MDVDITITHPFVSRNTARPQRGPDLLSRVFSRTLQEGLDSGMINLFALNDGGNYFTLGIFSQNKGGSLSFFPDFYHQLKRDYVIRFGKKKVSEKTAAVSDHLTLPPNFSKKGGHATGLINAIHKKITRSDLAEIDDLPGVYCWFSIVVSDPTLLNDLPPALKLKASAPKPHVDLLAENIKSCVGMNWQTSFPETIQDGRIGCIQVFVVPKNYIGEIRAYGDLFTKSTLCGKLSVTNRISCKGSLLSLGSAIDFDLYVVSFNLEGTPKDPLLLVETFKTSPYFT